MSDGADPLAFTGFGTMIVGGGGLAYTGVGLQLWWIAAVLLGVGILAIATARVAARRAARR